MAPWSPRSGVRSGCESVEAARDARAVLWAAWARRILPCSARQALLPVMQPQRADTPSMAQAAVLDGRRPRRVAPELLARTELFSQLGPPALLQLAEYVELVSVEAESVVFRQGDPGDALYVVARGAVAVLTTDPASGKASWLTTLEEGELFGEMALLTGEPRSASIRVERDGALLRLDRARFLDLLVQEPSVAQAITSVLIKRLRTADQLRARVEQELLLARHVQQFLLPHEVPRLPGWHLAAYYRPALEVGGDYYDFISLPDGQLGLFIGDVTDKGVPAALVMAAARSVLRGAAQQHAAPGLVLQRANDLLCQDTPPAMFVTCFYARLDPSSGRLRYANAGHDLPVVRRADGTVAELKARGTPLGLLPAMQYEERELTLAPGEHALFYSDGLAEAHSPSGAMLGFPRVRELVGAHPGGELFIGEILSEMERFTGPGWRQEDDVTLVTLRHDGAGR